MCDYVRATTLDQLPPGKSRLVFAGGKPVALFNVEGHVYALDDACPHAGSSLGMGKFDGAIVQCRAHGLRFDVRNGQMPGSSGLWATSLPVRVSGNEVSVCVERQPGVAGADCLTGRPSAACGDSE